MIKRYLLIGVVSVAGLLIVAAIITGNTNTGEQQQRPALSNATANITTAVPEANTNNSRRCSIKHGQSRARCAGHVLFRLYKPD